MMDLAAALWNKRQAISRAKERLAMLHRVVDSPGDLDLGTSIQLYAFCLEFAPDLIVELGRRYGNSTCVFTQAANELGNTKILSIDYDPGWSNRTVSRLKKAVSPEWFDPLRVLKEDIRKLSFSEIFASGNHIFLYWDAHGADLAKYVLAEALPHLRHKRHIVVVHDITDARFFNVDPSYVGADGLPRFWLANLVSPFEELIPLYDFLSRNRIAFVTPLESLNQTLLHNREHCAELEKLWGNNFSAPTPLEAGHWIYFSLNNRDQQALETNLIFPQLTVLKYGQEKLRSLRLKQAVKKATPALVLELLRDFKRTWNTHF
jgi:predicted O-methyltransferase YrrM